VLVDKLGWINHTTVDLAFKQFGKHKCPGPDGYRPIVLCNLPFKARELLIQIFNATIQLKYTPKLWRSSDVIFLPKPGKDDYTERRAFRPISLMPFLFKTLERLVKWHMEQHATTLHKDQHAFRKGHCTENALSHMVDSIERGFRHNQIVLAVFLDIKGAFDNLTTDVIIHGMHKHDVEDQITNWLNEYLNNRYCRIKGSNQYFKLACGTGQGGILSPSIWNFVMDTFLELYEAHAAEAIAYADDGALIIIADDMETAELQMQSAIDKAETWATAVGLQFSVAKTKAIIFSRSKDPPDLSTPLIMADEEIEVVYTFKYLGILLDSRLDWTPHIDLKIKKAKKYLMMLHNGIGATWGPSPAITLWLYTGIVRPFLTYGSVVWARKTSMARVVAKLTKLQRLALVLVAPIRQHTPTAGLELVFGLPPLELHIQFLAASTYGRLNLLPKGWDGKNGRKPGHIKWLQSIACDLPNHDLLDRCVEYSWHNQFTTSIGDGKDTTLTTGLLCYTDGSGQNGNSGAGIAIYKDDQCTAIHTDSLYTGIGTVFQAELCAIQMACVFASTMADTQVLILSDSQAAILATKHPLIYSQTVFATVNSLNALANLGKNVTLQWVRGHTNTAGNDLADYMAKTGSTLQTMGPEPFLPLSRAVCRQATRDQLLYLWTDKWQCSRHYRQTKIFFPTPDNTKSRHLLKQSRAETGLLARHLTGFSNLNYAQSLQQHGLDPICRLCGEDREESQHIIRYCPALIRTRIDTLCQITITDEWSVFGLLHFLSSPTVKRLEDANRTGLIPQTPPPSPRHQQPHRRGSPRSSRSSFSIEE
jgi:ribonuclease HI